MPSRWSASRLASRSLARSALALAAVGVVACGGDDPKNPTDTQADTSSEVASEVTAGDTVTAEIDFDTTEPPPVESVFLAGATPGQSIGAGPFPNDSLVVNGAVDLAPLGGDARFGNLAKAEILANLDKAIATKGRFAFAAAAFLPMEVAPDLTSFVGRVHYISLGGSDNGKDIPAQVRWFAPARVLVALPAWGTWLVPGSRYALVVDPGVKDELGRTLARPTNIDTLATNDAAWEAFRSSTHIPPNWVMATVFTTEESLPFMQALMAATDAFALTAPTRHVARDVVADGWVTATDISGAALETYFGVSDLTTGPLAYLPTSWGEGDRVAAGTIDGATEYRGGSFHAPIAYVVNGSFAAPSFGQARLNETSEVVQGPIHYTAGKPVPTSTVLVPFTAFFCHQHVQAGVLKTTPAIPVAVFTHGGTAIRADALAFANLNCVRGVATIVADLPFHGGRQAVTYLPGPGVVAPTQPDIYNTYTGTAGQDYVGDSGPPTANVGGLFALGSVFDPGVMEASFIQPAVELHTLVRYLRDTTATGLGAAIGVTFDTTSLVHEALSFGTSFSTAELAATHDFDAVIESVGSGMLFAANVTMAPANADLGSGIISSVLGLKSTPVDLQAAGWADPVMALITWLHERGDPAAYAPFVLRNRADGHPPHVLGFGDSWDETLFGPAQLSFANAWGVPVFTGGASWTLDPAMPGAATTDAQVLGADVAGNLAVGDKMVSAGWFYLATACHAMVISPICTTRVTPPYPPIVKRDTPLETVSPICQMQNAIAGFLGDLGRGDVPVVRAPSGTCADLYGPPPDGP